MSCTNKQPEPFLVEQHQIGFLTDSTQVKDLDMVFPKDSIVKFNAGDDFMGSINTIDVYEKGGAKLLSLYPREISDSTSTIGSIHILDQRYQTAKKIGLNSTFKDIKNAYTITSIDNLINMISVNVKEIDASFTIDKNKLPTNMRFDMKLKIAPMMIPDDVKVKFFIIHW